MRYREFGHSGSTHRHQPLSDIGSGRHRHPQSVCRILVHEAPVGSEQKTPFCLAEAREITRHPIAHPIRYAATARRELRGQHLQQGRFSRTGFANDRQHLAGIKLKRNIPTGQKPPVRLAQVFANQDRLINVLHQATR